MLLLENNYLSFFSVGRALQPQNLLDGDIGAELPSEKLRFVGPSDSSSDSKAIPHTEQ